MTDEEILLKYKNEIDNDIEKYIKENDLNTEHEIQAFTTRYKRLCSEG